MFDVDAMILAPMMAAGVFGENVQPTYLPAAGGSFSVDGVFDDPYLKVDVLDDGAPGFVTTNPVLGVRLAQFPAGIAPTAGDKVQVAKTAKAYFVNEVQPDGQGWALLQLTVQGS